MNVSLTTHMQPIAVLHTDETQITVGKHLPIGILRKLCKTGGIVLWDYEGLWTMIDRPTLEMLLSQYRDAQLEAKTYPRARPRAVVIHTSATLLISPRTARALLAKADS